LECGDISPLSSARYVAPNQSADLSAHSKWGRRQKNARLAGGARLGYLWRVNTDDFSDAALVVLGHGTARNENSAAPVFQHAAELRRRKIFAGVREAFWKQEPQIKNVLAVVSAPRVFIAPLFVSEGWFSSEVIPRELGFPDIPPISHFAKCDNRQALLFYCKPIGTHDSMTRVILSRADEVVKRFPFPRAPKNSETTLFIAGHGTEKNENSRKTVEWQVELIRAMKIYADVRAIFIEESPRIDECYSLAPTKHAVVVPFFISDGLHTQEDIPVLLGESKRIVEQRIAAGQPAWRNPTEKNGKLVWYSPAVGTEPHMADVILERVKEAAATDASRFTI
jgi:sirohydrochlorin cobaltochelatase